MSVRIVQQRLNSYDCRTEIEEHQAIREITQEIMLASLGRGDFFKHVLFQGGTCLRIFHGLNRFSEDMDFLLREPEPDFQLKPYLDNLADELTAYGYRIEISDRSEAGTGVRRTFLKDSSLGKLINLRHMSQSGPQSKIRVKLEVDINPPTGSGEEFLYLDFPFVSAVAAQDKPSLFAGKIHALLCREYIKGRDWYDFIWYTSRGISVNYKFLTSAINQYGPWKAEGVVTDKSWVVEELRERIESMDWKEAVDDVRFFIRAGEQPSLMLWSRELFLNQLDKWQKASG